MKEELLQNPVELRAGLPAPHFDDRSVVQRAQPVVPLAQIRNRVKLRKLWLLSGAFAIAMMLGAASALVAVRVKRSAATTEIPQVAGPETVTAAASTELPVAEEETLVDSGEEIVESTTVEATPVQPRPAPKTAEPLAQRPRTVNSRRDRDTVEPSEDEELEQMREATLYERWQEKRARRAARERRNRNNDRDLSHLDEIFEGQRRRPERPY